ncbi:universal stress protein [Chitinophaga sp. YR573]|uniref:universal stress protein n=1 Tax=Chitinophaga sp. YR573 TaxID=1881040 RepID=UPI00115FB61B
MNQFVKDHHINLLVLTSRSRNLLIDLFHKSVVVHICWHPTVPVIILPGDN